MFERSFRFLNSECMFQFEVFSDPGLNAHRENINSSSPTPRSVGRGIWGGGNFQSPKLQRVVGFSQLSDPGAPKCCRGCFLTPGPKSVVGVAILDPKSAKVL